MPRKRDSSFPTPDALVAFIRAHPGKVGTREIAREFGLKNADRAELKRILRELADEGLIAKRGRQISETAALPATMMADITGRDSDGELIATPTEWDEVENGEPPKIRIHVPRRPQPGVTTGVGDRALLRIEKLDEGDGAAYRGRVIKVIDRAKARVLGIFRSLPGGGGRLVPVDKKQAGRELNIAPTDAGGVNATIPSDRTPDTIMLPEAIALIDERVAKGGGKPKRGAKKVKAEKPAKSDAAPSTSKPAKKAAAKKSAAKPKSDAVSKARAPVTATAKTSPAKSAKPVAKKRAGKASG